MWAEFTIAPAVDVHGNRRSHVSGPRGTPPWLRSFLDDTLVSQPGFGEGALGGVSLSKASELNESSDEACWAGDLAGL